ncbi:hypothetical protein BX616_000860, partial [Lobosporangium transversale]
MNNSKLNPLELPEIISFVGDFLDLDDLLNCIVSPRLFIKHKKYIEGIIFEGNNLPDEYLLLQGCDHLQSIEYEELVYPKSVEYLNLIKNHNSTITRLHFYKTPTSYEFWETLLGCTNLEHLKVSHANIHDDIDVFLQVCKKLKHLDLDVISIYQLPPSFLCIESSGYNLPNIHTLHLQDVSIPEPPHPYTSAYCLGMFVRRCPGLRSLLFYELYKPNEVQHHFQYEPADPSDNSFYKETFLQHPWTLNNLSELILISAQLKDEDMAGLLRRMPELKRLQAPYCELGQLSLQELLSDKQEAFDNGQMVWKTRPQKLCETVERLAFNMSSVNVDGVAQTILSICPRLKDLRGSKITMTEIANGAEWVSTGLIKLDIYLEIDIDQETLEGMETARIVSNQLGRLIQLRSLDLT